MTLLDAYRFAIRHGKGTPYKAITLQDTDGNTSTATHRGVSQRANDGHFYSWQWKDTNLRFIELLGMAHMRSWVPRRTMILAKTEDGRIVGPFSFVSAS